jgi:hypothetical protein
MTTDPFASRIAQFRAPTIPRGVSDRSNLTDGNWLVISSRVPSLDPSSKTRISSTSF